MDITEVNWLVESCSQETRIAILYDEMNILKSQYTSNASKIDVLYIDDTINMLKKRIEILENSMRENGEKAVVKIRKRLGYQRMNVHRGRRD